jgi:hypothetical protein
MYRLWKPLKEPVGEVSVEEFSQVVREKFWAAAPNVSMTEAEVIIESDSWTVPPNPLSTEVEVVVESNSWAVRVAITVMLDVVCMVVKSPVVGLTMVVVVLEKVKLNDWKTGTVASIWPPVEDVMAGVDLLDIVALPPEKVAFGVYGALDSKSPEEEATKMLKPLADTAALMEVVEVDPAAKVTLVVALVEREMVLVRVGVMVVVRVIVVCSSSVELEIEASVVSAVVVGTGETTTVVVLVPVASTPDLLGVTPFSQEV